MPVAAVSLELALAGIVALAALALAVIWQVPKRQARRWRESGIEGTELAELENGARGTLVQLIGGVALILTFVATWAQIADSRRASEETLALTAAEQRNERFTRAMDQLASARMEIRVGAIAGLGAIARESAVHREPVAQVLVAYLRNHPQRPTRVPAPGALPPPDCTRRRSTFTMASPDTQAAVSVVVAQADLGRRPYNLSRLDFGGLDAGAADFGEANLQNAVLAFATLNGARFANASLTFAGLEHSCLRDSSFRGAAAPGARFDAADLSGADLSQADLREADLRHVRLDGASLDGTNLRGADLTAASVTARQLRGAATDACTRLPWRPAVPDRCGAAGGKG